MKAQVQSRAGKDPGNGRGLAWATECVPSLPGELGETLGQTKRGFWGVVRHWPSIREALGSVPRVACAHTHVCAHTHTCVCAYTYTCSHTMHTHVCALTHMHPYPCSHTQTNIPSNPTIISLSPPSSSSLSSSSSFHRQPTEYHLSILVILDLIVSQRHVAQLLLLSHHV